MGILGKISSFEKEAVDIEKKRMNLSGTGNDVGDSQTLSTMGFSVVVDKDWFMLVSDSGIKGNKGSTKYSLIMNAGSTAAFFMVAICLVGILVQRELLNMGDKDLAIYWALPVSFLVLSVLIMGVGFALTNINIKYRGLKVSGGGEKIEVMNEHGGCTVDKKDAKIQVEVSPFLNNLADCYEYYLVSGGSRHKFNEKGGYRHLKKKNTEYIPKELGRILKIPVEVSDKS